MIVDTRGTQAPCTAALGEIAHGTGGGGGCRHISDMHVGASTVGGCSCPTNSADARCTHTLCCRCVRASEGEGHSIRFICATRDDERAQQQHNAPSHLPPQAR